MVLRDIPIHPDPFRRQCQGAATTTRRNIQTAWRMGHAIRKHMAQVNGNQPLAGIIELDETYIGGQKADMQGGKGKVIIFGMLSRDGNVMTKVVPNCKRQSLYPHIITNIIRGSTIYTDEHTTYHKLSWLGYKHDHVNHGRKEYARGNCHVNTLEGFWARLKLSFRGTHIWVSPQHLQKYADEFCYRFNRRHCPEKMIVELLETWPPP